MSKNQAKGLLVDVHMGEILLREGSSKFMPSLFSIVVHSFEMPSQNADLEHNRFTTPTY